MDVRTFALLQMHGDPDDLLTHRRILACLDAMNPPSAEKEGVETLKRLHFEEFLRVHRKHSRVKVSDKRTQLREDCRARWANAKSVSVETVQQRYPVWFQAEKAEHFEDHFEDHTARAHIETKQQSNAQSFGPPTVPQRHSHLNLQRNVVDHAPANDAHNGNYIQNDPNQNGVVQPLSGFLRKRSAAPPLPLHGDHDDDDMIPQYPMQKRGSVNSTRKNPFQTAGEKLQHDRLTGKDKSIDDDHGYRNGRGGRVPSGGRSSRQGSYHPINPNVLLGGGRQDDAEDTNGSAVNKKFVSPLLENRGDNKPHRKGANSNPAPTEDDDDIDPRLKSCDPELIAKIEMEIVDYGDPIAFDDIAGLDFAKKCVNELVIWPMARPDIFTGLRALPKGLLLFGPPGTGKTLIGKAIANQSGATFFSISASSLTSKWIGEGEKLVRTLFAVAAVKQPSVIFIDEIDSLLTQRSSEENEASRRMKTEFLVQLDGAGTKAKDVILVVGATNRPQELDEAARRRFVKRLYIPLPSFDARLDMVNRLLKDNKHDLSEENKQFVAESTKGYSGADVRALCTEAAMGPIRSCIDIRTMDADAVRPISLDDFKSALRGVRSSVATKDLEFYRVWNDEFGSFPFESHEG